MFKKMGEGAGQIEAHFLEAKGFAEKEIIPVGALLHALRVVWHSRVSPGPPMRELHGDQNEL